LTPTLLAPFDRGVPDTPAKGEETSALVLYISIGNVEMLLNVDWHSMFVPEESLIEIFIRGSILYLVMFLLLRVFRRQAGALGIADLLVIVVIADAAQNGMAGDSKSITEAVLLIITIFFWNYLLDLLGYKYSFVQGILESEPLLLIKDGQLQHENMAKEMITEDELRAQLREQGIENISSVKKSCLESNGHFSVILDAGSRSKQKSNESGASAVN